MMKLSWSLANWTSADVTPKEMHRATFVWAEQCWSDTIVYPSCHNDGGALRINVRALR